MAWKFDSPLYSLSDAETNKRVCQEWQAEKMGGVQSDNNRLPKPVVALIGLVIVTAFFVTGPLWGQRPTADLYTGYIKLMDSPQVQSIATDKGKMEYIVSNGRDAAKQPQLDRHPLPMDDLRMIRDQVIELQNNGVNLKEYTVIGNKVVLANFEGELKPKDEVTSDGNLRHRVQPSWDKGYLIDLFYVSYFLIAMFVLTKRLPHHSWKLDRSLSFKTYKGVNHD